MPVLGPLFRHELVRLAHRQRLTLWRSVYALCLVGIAAITFAAATNGFEKRLTPFLTARIAEALFVGLMLLQFVLAAVLIPQWTADVVAGEKERQTLPFLLVSDLTSREVVLGKMAARLAQVSMFLFAGLPVLAMLQLYGGADIELIVWVVLSLVATLLSASGAAILASVAERTTRQATKRAAQIFAVYAFWPMAADWLCRAWPMIGYFPRTLGWQVSYTLDDLIAVINWGNPLYVGRELINQLRAGGTVAATIAPMAAQYILFHMIAAGICTGWAIRRLRPVHAEQGDGPPVPKANVPKLLKPPGRPTVGERPVFWKMLHCDARLSRTIWQFNLMRFIYVASYLFQPALLVMIAIQVGSRNAQAVTDVSMIVVRGVVTVVLAALCMHAAGLAAACIGRERQKQTLDELLLTDLTVEEILAQKWIASFWSGRWVLLWVLVQWAIGIAVGALHPMAVVAVTLAWTAFAASGTSLGLYWAVRTPTMQRANAWTGLCGFALVAVPVVLAMFLLIWTDARRGSELLAMSPPGTLGLAAISPDNWAQLRRGEWSYLLMAAACLACIAFHAILAWRLWRAACRRFAIVTGRAPESWRAVAPGEVS
ncbi:MAG: ABC transporter permease subunit [Gemmataceae bacterium]